MILPAYVCAFCGESYGRKDEDTAAGWHEGECEVCGDEHVMVTSVRTFGGLYDTWKDGREFR